MKPIHILALKTEGQTDFLPALRGVLSQVGDSGKGVTAEQASIEESDVGRASREAINRTRPNLVLFCLETGRSETARAILMAAQGASPPVAAVALTLGAEPQEVCALLDLGVEDFLTMPVTVQELLPRLWRIGSPDRHRQPLFQLEQELGLGQFVGESPALRAAQRRIAAVAKCDATVLVTGETGTGKELGARAIHYLGARAKKPFAPINCGAIPMELAENELFGHAKGAFTGAGATKPGLIEPADGGTIFLDEVDALPLGAQVKLLRFLQEKQFRPLGSARTQTVDVRVVAACNSSLEEAVRAGRFRQDLYYRINVIPIAMPPLRDRRTDIPLLARHFLARYAEKFGTSVKGLSPCALQKLVAYDWPGNIRELENTIERGLVLSESRILQGSDISLSISETAPCASFKGLKAQTVMQFERSYLQQLLVTHEGNITKAAQAAQKDRRAFWQLMRKHHLAVTIRKSGPQPGSENHRSSAA